MRESHRRNRDPSKFNLWPPALAGAQDHIFGSADSALDAMDAIIALINRKYKKKKTPGIANVPAFFVENLELRFDARLKNLRVEAGICESTVFVLIPKPKAATREDLKNLEIQYCIAFGPMIKEMQLRVGLQYFRSLEPEPQEELVQEYVKSKRKKETRKESTA